jgi:regulator of RNase E activity RraA
MVVLIMTQSRLSREVILGFLELSTSNISDALDSLRIRGGCEGIRPITHGAKFAGLAYTIKYRPAGLVPGTVGDYIDDVPPGDVIVLDNEGRTSCTVWGDLLTLAAVRKGIGATVIDGVCRDIERVSELRYPLFSRGHFMVTGKDRVEVAGVNVPVSISGVQVRPGDLVVGDDSGVLVVPIEKAEEVLKLARMIHNNEAAIEKEVEKGVPLREARRKFRYHELQRARPILNA